MDIEPVHFVGRGPLGWLWQWGWYHIDWMPYCLWTYIGRLPFRWAYARRHYMHLLLH